MTTTLQGRTQAGPPVRARRSRRRTAPRAGRKWWSAGLLIAFLVLWEFAADLGWQDPRWISSPSLVLREIWAWIGDGTLLDNLAPTLRIAFLAFLISAGLGAVVAVLLSAVRWLDDVVGWLLTLVYAIPKPALMPMFIIIFGVRETPKFALAIMLLFFIFYYNIRAGLDEQRSDFRDAMLVLGGSRRDIGLHLTLPTLIPFIVASARIAAPMAILAVTFAEFFAQGAGMGRLIQQAQVSLDAGTLMSAIVVLTIVGSLVDLALRIVGRRTARWNVGSVQ